MLISSSVPTQTNVLFFSLKSIINHLGHWSGRHQTYNDLKFCRDAKKTIFNNICLNSWNQNPRHFLYSFYNKWRTVHCVMYTHNTPHGSCYVLVSVNHCVRSRHLYALIKRIKEGGGVTQLVEREGGGCIFNRG